MASESLGRNESERIGDLENLTLQGPSPRPSGEGRGLGLWSVKFSRSPMRSLSLRPNDSLAILKDGFVDRLSSLRFLHEDDPSYRVLTVSLVSLTLTEYACLFWTHALRYRCPLIWG